MERPVLDASAREASFVELETQREAEVQARLDLETARERVRAEELRVESLREQLNAERHAAEEAARRAVQRNRQREIAALLLECGLVALQRKFLLLGRLQGRLGATQRVARGHVGKLTR